MPDDEGPAAPDDDHPRRFRYLKLELSALEAMLDAAELGEDPPPNEDPNPPPDPEEEP